jgi:hypothetical protein
MTQEENRLAFVEWFNKTNQSKEMMDWSFEVWKAALSHQAAETGKDHNIREFVNDLVKTFNTYSATGQLRERLVDIVYAHLKLLPTYERANKDAEIERLKAKQRKIYAAFYVNMLRVYPEKSHDDIRAAVDEAIDQARKESE